MSLRQRDLSTTDFRKRSVRIGGQLRERARPILKTGPCLGILISLCLVGCETKSSSKAEPSHKHHAHVHQRPTFTDSVAQVRSRSTRFTSHLITTDVALENWKKRTLLEFIRQLPEGAAVTGLKKKDWDRVNAISKELLQVMEPVDAVSNHGISVDAERFTVLITELEKLVVSSESLDL